MNTRLLRMGKRNGTTRTWTVPGKPHGIRVLRVAMWPVTLAVYWPDPENGYLRGARFDWHHKVIKRNVRDVLRTAAIT